MINIDQFMVITFRNMIKTVSDIFIHFQYYRISQSKSCYDYSSQLSQYLGGLATKTITGSVPNKKEVSIQQALSISRSPLK